MMFVFVVLLVIVLNILCGCWVLGLIDWLCVLMILSVGIM